METISFVLGMASVAVIAIAIVAVYAFVKVNKLKNIIDQQIDSNGRVEELLHRRIDDEIRSVYSTLDSRLDKLESKINNKQLIKG